MSTARQDARGPGATVHCRWHGRCAHSRFAGATENVTLSIYGVDLPASEVAASTEIGAFLQGKGVRPYDGPLTVTATWIDPLDHSNTSGPVPVSITGALVDPAGLSATRLLRRRLRLSPRRPPPPRAPRLQRNRPRVLRRVRVPRRLPVWRLPAPRLLPARARWPGRAARWVGSSSPWGPF